MPNNCKACSYSPLDLHHETICGFQSTDRSEEFVIISFNGPLHYLNKSMLRSCLVNACQLDPTLVNARKKSTQTKEMITEVKLACFQAQHM